MEILKGWGGRGFEQHNIPARGGGRVLCIYGGDREVGRIFFSVLNLQFRVFVSIFWVNWVSKVHCR